MDRKFQVYAIAIFLVVVVLALYFSEGFSFREVYDFESCADAGNPIMESYPRQCRHKEITYVEDIASDLNNYFSDELYDQGVKNGGGMPIEGFNPGLYKQVFPGFVDSDFDGAEAIGGIWVFNQELKWIEYNLGGPITSADGTVTDKGLVKVLDNLEERLYIEVNSKVDVDNIISLLSIHKCGDDERLIDACIAIYDPVCGWNDPEKVQCIKYPCAQDYSNGCEACKQDNILYWTPGMCPQ